MTSIFKAILNLFIYEKEGSCFCMKIISILLHIRKITSFYIYSFCSVIIVQFLFRFRGRRRLLLFNGVLFTQEILNETILLRMDYNVAHRLGKTES